MGCDTLPPSPNTWRDEIARANAFQTDGMIRRGDQDVLLLINVEGCLISRSAFKQIKMDIKRSKTTAQKVSHLRVNDILAFFLRILSQISNTNTKPFATKSEALDWLVASSTREGRLSSG